MGPEHPLLRTRRRTIATRTRPICLGFLVTVCGFWWPVGSTPLAAQDVGGSLAGRVVDEAGTALEGVLARLTDPRRSLDFTTTTDARGGFRFVSLTVGEYELTLQHIGYRTHVQLGVTVRLGATVSLGEIGLVVEAVEVDPIEVNARALAIDPVSTEVGFELKSEVFERLPSGRDFKSIAMLLPQANESFFGDPFNVSGSTGLANMYYIDGMNVTDIFRGRAGTDLPFNFVEAIELKQGGYQAEYGQALGGVFNAVTRTGTNDFEFDAFAYMSGSGLAADPKPVPGTSGTDAFSDYDVGVSASGPLVRDQLWYVAAYNPRFEGSDVELSGFGVQRASVTRHMFAGKLDWQAGEDSRLSLSVFGDPTRIDDVNPPESGTFLETIDPALLIRDEGSINASLKATSSVGANWLLEGTVGYHSRRESSRGATEIGRTEPRFNDLTHPSGLIAISGGVFGEERFNSRRALAKGAVTRFVGNHTIKFGGEFQNNIMDWFTDGPGGLGKYADDQYVGFYELHDGVVHNRIGSVFLQDEWAVSSRLQLNLGLRWEGQWLDGGEGGVLQPIPDQWQPRVGFVYQPGELGTQKLYGYAGRHYQQLALLMTALEFSTGNRIGQRVSTTDPRTDPDAEVEIIEFVGPDDHFLERIEGLNGEHLDEFVLGYERLLGDGFKLGIKGTHRVLRDNIEIAFNPDPPPMAAGGNRGKGSMAEYGDPERKYSAAEVSLQHQSARAAFLASYVLSRSYGNYQGLFGTESGGLESGSFGPNNNQTLYAIAQLDNSRGLLPQDRTHVVKLSGAYVFDFGLTAGTFFSVASGTPLNEFQYLPTGFYTPLFRVPRGSAGRTPAIWDLSFRLGYDLPTRFAGRVVLDLLHVGNPQGVTNTDQWSYNSSLCDDGSRACNQSDSYDDAIAGAAQPNPAFGDPIAFQPPFTVRLGLEVGLGGG